MKGGVNQELGRTFQVEKHKKKITRSKIPGLSGGIRAGLGLLLEPPVNPFQTPNGT